MPSMEITRHPNLQAGLSSGRQVSVGSLGGAAVNISALGATFGCPRGEKRAGKRVQADTGRFSVKTNTIGDRMLCAWKTGAGWVKVQTRSAKYARKLAQRSDSQPAGVGVAGGYLRIYAFNHGMAWAERLIRRYTGQPMATSGGFLSPAAPPSNPYPPGLSKLIPQLELPLELFKTSTSAVKGKFTRDE